jgi:uncharacterized membrane protein
LQAQSMKEVGTAILVFTLALSVAYLIAENAMLKKALAAENPGVQSPMPPRLEKAFIRIGISGAILGFALRLLST